MPRLRRPSPALVISIVALFVAMGGTGYAAVHLSKNSVGASQIRTGAVGTSEVKNHSLKTTDFNGSAIGALTGKTGPAGPRGLTGATGAKGLTGATGATGPSDAWEKDFTSGNPVFALAPGSYVLGGGASVVNSSASPVVLNCFWVLDVPPADAISHAQTPGEEQDVAATNGKGAVSTPGSVSVTGPSNFSVALNCSAGAQSIIGLAIVTRVAALH